MFHKILFKGDYDLDLDFQGHIISYSLAIF